MRLSITIVAAVAVLTLAPGCGSRAASPGGARLAVVATTTQVGSVARQVGGDDIKLTVLLQPGVEAHDFELTPPAAAAIEDADLILTSGAGLESWLQDALETIGASEAVRDMSTGVELRAPAVGAGERGDEGAAAVDPHYWLSAPNSIVMVENVRDALIAADESKAPLFEQRAEQLVERLGAADAEVRRLMDKVPAERRGVVTNHDALGYFIDEYGLRLVGSVFPSLDVSAEPNPAQLAELVEVIREEEVAAIFSESAVSPRLAQAIAAESEARVVDDPLYTDSLGPPNSGVDTLDRMLLHNARVIHDALTDSP